MTPMATKNQLLVVFHDRCPDGYASAAAVHEYMQKTNELCLEVKYLPMTYEARDRHDYMQHFTHDANKTILCVDFSLSPAVTQALLERDVAITFADHHSYEVDDSERYERLEQEYPSQGVPLGEGFHIFNYGNDLGSGVVHTHALFAFIAGEEFTHAYGKDVSLINQRDTWRKVDPDVDVYFHFMTPKTIAAAIKATEGVLLNMPMFYQQYRLNVDHYFANRDSYMIAAPLMSKCLMETAANHFHDNHAIIEVGRDRIAFVNGLRLIDGEMVDYALKERDFTAIVIVREFTKGVTELSVRTRNARAKYLAEKLTNKLVLLGRFGQVTTGGHLNAAGISISKTIDVLDVMKAMEAVLLWSCKTHTD